jgi:FAD/FMN-containing dehydrogenase
MDAFVRDLTRLFGNESVLPAKDVSRRACSHWDPSPTQARALVRPATTADVSRLLALCNERGQAVVVQGGRTGVCGGESSRDTDIILSLERMKTIEEIDVVDRTVTLQAGCVLESVQTAVANRGLSLPVDLGARASCTIGGNIATNAGGINVIRYGMMRERVRGLEAVLADGTVISSMNRMLKNNAGYDLKHLFIGTEGTLGVVTRAILSLEESAPFEFDALVALSDFDAVSRLLRHLYKSLGGQLVAFEVMWGDYYRTIAQSGNRLAPIQLNYDFYVLIRASSSAADARGTFELALEAAMEAGLLEDAVVAKSNVEARQLWDIRENFEPLLRNKPYFIYDIGLPIRHMQSYVAEVRARLSSEWPDHRAYVFGHIGDGNLHWIVSPQEDAPDTHARVDCQIYEPLRKLGGSISAEHGIGTERRLYLQISRSAEEIELMRGLKRWLDPKGTLNPGRVIPGESDNSPTAAPSGTHPSAPCRRAS